MCSVCGCGKDDVRVEGHNHAGAGTAAHHHHHDHEALHDHHHHGDGGVHDYGSGPAGGHVHGMSQGRMIQIEQDILAKNDAFAAANRDRLETRGVLALNLLSSPGSGKTTLLVKTIEALQPDVSLAVIEGDQQTATDADRIRATGTPAIQVNTGKGCHLDAHMVGHALDNLAPGPGSVLMIENVGNLVCPAAFDLGEAFKVVMLSVTEGEDKPLKYPDMFHAADLMLLSKTDLLPHVDFDTARCVELARGINPALEILTLSARTGDGMPAWLDWIKSAHGRVRCNRPSSAAAE